MIVVCFLLFLLILVIILEHRSRESGLRRLSLDHYFSDSLSEPKAPLDLVIVFQNRGSFVLPFLRYRMAIPKGLTPLIAEESLKHGFNDKNYVTGTVWLGRKQHVEKRISVSAAVRGRYLLDDLLIYAGDFLGIKESVQFYQPFGELIVYPKMSASVDVEQVFGGFLGELSVNRFIMEDPVLTLGYREYSGREPMKSISWAQSARKGELMVKKYDYTLEPTVSVCLNIECMPDCSGERARELIERSYEIARTVCATLEDKRIKYDFRMNARLAGSFSDGTYTPEGLGRKHYYGILESLGRAVNEPSLSCELLLERTMRSADQNNGIVFISPGDTDDMALAAKRFAMRYGITLLILSAEEVGKC